MKRSRARTKKVRLVFSGDVHRDDVVVGSHGNTDIKVKGTFHLSGIVYCPSYTVTLTIEGDGRIVFHGKCHRVIIKKMMGNCTLDLSAVTCKELQCASLKGKSVVVAGKVRAITPAILEDEATLYMQEGQLIFNPTTSGKSRILTMNAGAMEEEFGVRA